MTGQAAAVPESLDSAVETVLGFVNTRFDGKGGHIERFGDAADFTDWAREQGLLSDETVSESEVAAARELRAALVAVLLDHADHPESTEMQVQDAERHLEHVSELYPVRVTLSTRGSTVAAQHRGAGGVFGSVLAAADQIAQHDAWWRMKACCSTPCQHGLFDRTKNGSQKFCSPK